MRNWDFVNIIPDNVQSLTLNNIWTTAGLRIGLISCYEQTCFLFLGVLHCMPTYHLSLSFNMWFVVLYTLLKRHIFLLSGWHSSISTSDFKSVYKVNETTGKPQCIFFMLICQWKDKVGDIQDILFCHILVNKRQKNMKTKNMLNIWKSTAHQRTLQLISSKELRK